MSFTTLPSFFSKGVKSDKWRGCFMKWSCIFFSTAYYTYVLKRPKDQCEMLSLSSSISFLVYVFIIILCFGYHFFDKKRVKVDICHLSLHYRLQLLLNFSHIPFCKYSSTTWQRQPANFCTRWAAVAQEICHRWWESVKTYSSFLL